MQGLALTALGAVVVDVPYQFACPRTKCQFELRCDADEEAVRLARAHARWAHHSHIAPADLDRWVTRVDIA